MKTKTISAFISLAVLACTGWADTVTYDEHNRITSIDYGSGKSITYTYDKVGNRVTMVSTGLPTPSPYAANNVPVWWLNKFGFTTNLDAITALDTDGDGQITADEWAANTDPTDRNSVLKFDEFLVATAAQTVDLRWKTETGRRYRLEQSTDLEDWDPVPGCENIQGDGNYIECDLTGITEPKIFFKIVVWKP
jgi:YD repeat-containing protein